MICIISRNRMVKIRPPTICQFCVFTGEKSIIAWLMAMGPLVCWCRLPKGPVSCGNGDSARATEGLLGRLLAWLDAGRWWCFPAFPISLSSSSLIVLLLDFIFQETRFRLLYLMRYQSLHLCVKDIVWFWVALWKNRKCWVDCPSWNLSFRLDLG